MKMLVAYPTHENTPGGGHKDRRVNAVGLLSCGKYKMCKVLESWCQVNDEWKQTDEASKHGIKVEYDQSESGKRFVRDCVSGSEHSLTITSPSTFPKELRCREWTYDTPQRTE